MYVTLCATKPPAHAEDVDTISSQNVETPSISARENLIEFCRHETFSTYSKYSRCTAHNNI